MADSNDWVQVGLVGIESGTCLIVDPTYHRDGFYGVEEVEAVTLEVVGSPARVGTLKLPDGMIVGTAVATGFGDGEYPVEVRYADTRWGRRVAEVRVRFLDENEIADSN